MIKLLPFKPEHILCSRKEKLGTLKLLKHLSFEASEAITCFLKRDYSKFDAQVGDTSCQIRAYKICLLAIQPDFLNLLLFYDSSLQKYNLMLTKIINKYEQLFDSCSSYQQDLDKKETVQSFLSRNGIQLELASNLLFIISSYLLNKYCIKDIENIPCAIDYSKIKREFNLGSTPARNLANHLQSFLSISSCEFIFTLLKVYKIPDGNHQLLKKLVKVGDRKRKLIPYYNSTKLLIHNAESEKLPVLLSITVNSKGTYTKIVLLYRMNKETGYYELAEKNIDYTLLDSCVVFKGCATRTDSDTHSIKNYVNRLINFSFEKLVLSNAATHPQFTGETLTQFRMNPYKELGSENMRFQQWIEQMNQELFEIQKLSRDAGCSRQNQRLFYIKHIFCDVIENELKDANFLIRKSEPSLAIGNQHPEKIGPKHISLNQ